MKRFYEKLNAEQRELLVNLYIEGLEEADDEKVLKVMEFTLFDSELDQMIDEINSYYVGELGLEDLAQTVIKLADEHLQTRYEETDFIPKILTFGDVARQLEAKNRVPSGEEDSNQQLIKNEIPLPEYLSLSEIKKVAAHLKLTFKERYWMPFFKEASFLVLRGSQQQAFAARAKRKPKSGEQKNESNEKVGD